MNLLALTCSQAVQQFQQRYGRGGFHAKALYRAFYNRANLNIASLPEFKVSDPVLARRVSEDLCIKLPYLEKKVSCEGVTKLIFRLSDGLCIETVVIPMANHFTVCVSSQVGCRMGCRICHTGKMGFKRNLSTDEIVAQIYYTKVILGHNVRNAVFMGMGEPLDNFCQVIQAIEVLEDQRGLNIAKRRITLSTAGLADGLLKLARLNWPQLKLAVSLNAPDDAVRDQIMPVNRRFPMKQLKNVLQDFPLAKGNFILAEYVVIKGLNDGPAQARQLVSYLSNLPVKVNLIPFNPSPGLIFDAPFKKDFDRFHKELIQNNVFVRLRSSKGSAIRAACGQLGGG
ncbi:MAG: 23S rRNA (adenine(2503)-C(2))-methyltransferase RlmN [Desulfobacteraceae bacterium]|nr:23S rRNA (adenine(2503)-C(2))-methyltransferase RlmN [Desulfobacteraceae bacterium]